MGCSPFHSRVCLLVSSWLASAVKALLGTLSALALNSYSRPVRSPCCALVSRMAVRHLSTEAYLHVSIELPVYIVMPDGTDIGVSV